MCKPNQVSWLNTFVLSFSLLWLGCGESDTEKYDGPRGPENGFTPLVTAGENETVNNHLLRWLGNTEEQHMRRTNIADDKHDDLGPDKKVLDCTVYELDNYFFERLQTCKNLNWLRFGNRATVKHLEMISDFSKLKGLDLGDAEFSIEESQHLSSFQQLLWLRLNSKTGDPETTVDFPSLPNIEVLFLKGEKLVKSAIKASDSMPNVRTFTASNANLKDADLEVIAENWPSLQYLSIRKNKNLTSESIEYLSKLTHLRHLDIHDSSLANSLEELKSALPRCAVVR